ncbi:MAG: M61 family metallopeptidase [Bacteroidetes bacterium]|nr:M61 family metallopeptidase [Bacteroidota bacterium]
MIHYRIARDRAEPAHLRVDMEIGLTNEQASTALTVYLPEWRPGRYELGHFSRNLRGLRCATPEGKAIDLESTGRSSWKIHPNGHQRLQLTYLYRADQLDAGGCYVDDQLLYVNPVHCCLYTEEHRHEPLTVEIEGSKKYKVACGLTPKDDNLTITASNYDEWVDMPLMVSPLLTHRSFLHRDMEVHLWMRTQTYPELLPRYIWDLRRIMDIQVEIMGPLPVDSYHFLLLALPYAHYHGVEHRNSTMMVLGPESEIFNSLYPELLGLSSHELFHTWNIKYIKPNDLMHYDYQHENYSPLGYVYEGFTTYYGDLTLLRGKLFSWHEYAHEVDVYLNRHLNGYARDNASLRDSSINTWVDGYGGAAAPHRSVSIYAEGMLSALCLDLNIRKKSGNRYSLDDLMRQLRQRADQGKGYDESDLIDFLEQATGHPFKGLFEQLYHRPATLIEPLNQVLDWIGCVLQPVESEDACARSIGLRLQGGTGAQQVIGVAPKSVADYSGIRVGDRVTDVKENQGEWVVRWTDRMQRSQISYMEADATSWFGSCRLLRLPTTHQEQDNNYRLWAGSTLF